MQLLVFLLVYPLLKLVSILPFPLFYKLSDGICFLLYHVFGYRKKVIRKNIRLCFPEYSSAEVNALVKAFYKHMCDCFLEMIKSMGMSEKSMRKRFRFLNIDDLLQFERNGQSVFVMIGHYSCWEWMLSLGYYMKNPFYGIYTPIRNPYFNKLIQRIRKKHKAFVLSRYKTVETIKKRENKKHRALYGFASDQSPKPKPKTYWRTFMGVQVPVFNGAERLARKFEIPIVYAYINRVKRGFYEVEFKVLSRAPHLEKPNYITDTFTEWVEHQIRKDPTQYLWSHDRFKYAKLD